MRTIRWLCCVCYERVASNHIHWIESSDGWRVAHNSKKRPCADIARKAHEDTGRWPWEATEEKS